MGLFHYFGWKFEDSFTWLFLAHLTTGSRGDVFVVRTSKLVENLGKKWVILIALQFRCTFYIPQTKRLRARKIGLHYKIRKACPFFCSALRASVSLRATCCAPARLWLAVIDFQNGEQQSRSGSDKKRRNRLQ